MKKRILLTILILTLLIVFGATVALAHSYVTYGEGYNYETTTGIASYMPSVGAIILSILVTFVTGALLRVFHTKKPSANVYKKYMSGPFVLDYRHVRGRVSIGEVVDFIGRRL